MDGFLGPQLRAVEFAMFSPDQIQKLAVVEVVTPLGLDPLGHPLPGGLYDMRMGPNGEQSGPCGTCQATDRNCPGHFGRIELPLPVVNPLFHKGLYSILRMVCTACHRILLPGRVKALLVAQLQLLDMGLVTEAQGLEDVVLALSAAGDGAPDAVTEVLVQDELAVHVAKLKDRPAGQSADTTLLEVLRAQFVNDALKQQAKGKTCCYCKAVVKAISSYQNRLISVVSKVEVANKFKDEPPSAPKRTTAFLLPSDSKAMMRFVWRENRDLLLSLFPVLSHTSMEHPSDLFFMEQVLVPPPKVRPLNYLQGKVLESGQSRVYKNILNQCIIIRNIRTVIDGRAEFISEEGRAVIATVRGETPLDKLNSAWGDLQGEVDHLLDIEMSKTTRAPNGEGLKQIVEKKEGVLRMHMMGKRVNFAARSVITPDPNLNVEEIGIPEAFAMKLTYPERYSGKNFEELRKLIENGPDVYPGANLVETGSGKVIKLMGGEQNRRKRVGVAKQLIHSGDDTDSARLGDKIVHRHLINGDMLLLNRQPTLHRPSIMAHKARVLKSEKTLRMHYSNCKSYNADFDGDEMNAHCPQNEIARSEAMHIVNVPNQYLVPKDGTPLGGLIQDHVISAVHLTVRGHLLCRDDYQQLVFQGLSHIRGDIKLLPPCMLKPRRLWSGKQVISTILLNITPKKKKPISMLANSKTSLKSWEKTPPRKWRAGGEPFRDPRTMSEAEVVVHQGQLVCGVLDKQHFGATQYSLTHCLFELYGGECSSAFLNSLGKLFTYNLQLIGFTIGVEDILVLPEPDRERRRIIEKARLIGDVAAMRALELETPPEDLCEQLEAAYFQDRISFRAKLDSEYKQALDEFTNGINKTCLPGGLISKFPRNNLQLMVVAGAKGSTVNTMQISCLLGQIELEGKRPPLMLSGRSLPSFRPFETTPRAGGFIDGRFLTGILPQDFFFHCMAGREGLIDTAVKTSRSGYLQRCLIKHLEGLSVAYDHTVRNHDGTVVQFAYGEDGMEVSKAVFFRPSQMDFLFRNRDSILHKPTLSALRDRDAALRIAQHKESVAGWQREFGRDRRLAAFTNFSASVRDAIPDKHRSSVCAKTGRPKAYRKTLKMWRKLDDDTRGEMRVDRCPDPVTTAFHPHRDLGAISEALDRLVSEYLLTRANTTTRKAARMQSLISLKAMTALCAPGEPVGLLAAQSVGEPSTQMTLNTFHFAGRGEMNVTLGIPRLREILMTASRHIKTPSMEIPLMPSHKADKHAERLRRTLQRVTVADVLENVTVKERLETWPSRTFTYTVRFNFLPHRCYRKEFQIKPTLILKHMEKSFLVALSKTIRLLGKRYGELIHESQEEKKAKEHEEVEDDPGEVDPPAVASRHGQGEEAESSDEEPDGDADASTARRRARHEEAREYDEDTDASDGPTDSEEEEEVERKPDVEAALPEEVAEALVKEAEARAALVLRTFHMIRSYHYDMDMEEWCELVISVPVTLSKIDFSTILREICENSVIYEVRGIRRAIVYKTNLGEVAIKTEGINITEMSRFNRVLNLPRLYCNDIHVMADTYGVEAAGRVVVRELQSVFQVYGITVDPRHLLLIADYMTMQGIFLPLNRTGMATGASALQQMTFESAISFLRKAVFRGRQDALSSPSARVMIGRPCRTGTGCFELRPAPTVLASN